jgi:hypothetical protein
MSIIEEIKMRVMAIRKNIEKFSLAIFDLNYLSYKLTEKNYLASI